jgi:hypothetical protein
VVPWLITGWRPGTTQPAVMVVVGAVLTAAGCGVLLHSFARFALDGVGPPAPDDDPAAGKPVRSARSRDEATAACR